MTERDSARFKLENIDCTQAFDLKEFHMEGSYDLAGNNFVVSDRTLADYNLLNNRPTIENVELVGNKSMSELGLGKAINSDILSLFK